MDNTENIKNIIRLFKRLGIKKYKLKSNNLTFFNKGLSKYNEGLFILNNNHDKYKDFVLKKANINNKVLILHDKPNMLVTYNFIHEIIITKLISDIYSLFSRTNIKYFYGYVIDNDIYMILNRIKADTLFFTYNSLSPFELNALFVHIIYHIFFLFENYTYGDNWDLHFGNIMVYKTDIKYIKYKYMNGDILKLRVFGYLPHIIDFGNVRIQKIKYKNKIYPKTDYLISMYWLDKLTKNKHEFHYKFFTSILKFFEICQEFEIFNLFTYEWNNVKKNNPETYTTFTCEELLHRPKISKFINEKMK